MRPALAVPPAVAAVLGAAPARAAGTGLDGPAGFPAVLAVLLALLLALALFLARRGAGARREMAERLREGERRLSQMAEAIDQVFFLRTPRGLLYLSRAYERLFGRSVAEMLADPFSFLRAVHPEDLERVRAAYLAFREGADFREQFRVLRPGDGVRWVRVRTFPVPGDPERRVAGVIDDVTERVAFEADLARARDEALAAARARSLFLARMSHELRTPLNGVLGMLQVLETGPLSGEQRESVASALTAARGLLDVLNDILDFSEIEAGRPVLAESPLDPGELLRSAARTFEPQARAKGLTLAVEMEPGAPDAVLADEARLRQVLFHLLGNAVKFTGQGGVTVSGCWRAAPPRPGGPGRGHLVVTVADTGAGLAEERLDAVFEPFEQGDGSYSRRFGGTGLGLGIVRGLVRLLDGELLLHSAPGAGTVAEFSAAARPAPARDGRAPESENARNPG